MNENNWRHLSWYIIAGFNLVLLLWYVFYRLFWCRWCCCQYVDRGDVYSRTEDRVNNITTHVDSNQPHEIMQSPLQTIPQTIGVNGAYQYRYAGPYPVYVATPTSNIVPPEQQLPQSQFPQSQFPQAQFPQSQFPQNFAPPYYNPVASLAIAPESNIQKQDPSFPKY